MIFAIIRPDRRESVLVHAGTPQEVYAVVGLDAAHVDHGTIYRTADRSLAIVVGEFGLFEPPERIRYFSIGRQLYAGNAVLYAFDYVGETADLDPNAIPPITYYRDGFDVENAIRDDLIARPIIRRNDEVVWRWPERKPDLSAL